MALRFVEPSVIKLELTVGGGGCGGASSEGGVG